MPIHKVPEPVVFHGKKTATPPSGSLVITTTVTTVKRDDLDQDVSAPTQSSALYKDLPEVDRDSAIIKRESIIEREIREQQEREKTLREEGYLRTSSVHNKEEEQSEYERREKEHERLQAHESAVSRDIREQRERELELQALRKSSSSVSFVHADSTDGRSRVSSQDVEEHSAPPPAKDALVEQQSDSLIMTTVYKQDKASDNGLDQDGSVASSVTDDDDRTSSASITYEEALKTKSHAGESIIARELREQREREDELRKHYVERGFGNFLATQEPSDTPYNRPEPAQPDITKLPAHARANLKAYGRMSKSVSEPVQISALPTVKKEPNRQSSKIKESVSQDAISTSLQMDTVRESLEEDVAPVAANRPADPAQLASDRVDGLDHSYLFVPQHETPIEREMRLAREREEELRAARGLPKTAKDPSAVVEIKEISVPNPKPHVNYRKGDEGDGKFMQKLASGRLQYEIQKEKRREQDLKSQGMISTLSEERHSGPVRYVDVIPKDQVDGKKTPNWKLQATAGASPGSVVVPRAASSGSVSSASSYEALDAMTDSQNGSVPTSPPTPLVSGPRRSEPAVVQRYSTHTKQRDGRESVTERQSSQMAESRIEKELREMREREEELRSLRRSFSSFPPAKENSPAPNSEDSDRANGYNRSQSTTVTVSKTSSTSGGGGDAVKATRRKSALAEEWEKKFGAN